ncbi:MAG: ABC transporter substrate-binding protein, partial [Thermomicrobiales bacterium]
MSTENKHSDSADTASRSISRRSLVQTTGAFAIAPILFGGLPVVTNAQDATPGSTPAKTPVAGGRLRIGLQGDPTELDPALSNLNAVGVVVDLVYEGLVHEAPDLSPRPALAASWTISDDLLTYTFSLRSGVTFHNGRGLVADDVKYSFERIQNPDTASPWQTFLSGVKSITATDPGTVEIVLSAPDASFLARLCTRGLVIVPKEEVEKTGDLTQTMVGTGPFTFKEYIPSSS